MAQEYPRWSTFTPAFAAMELPRLLAEAKRAVAALQDAPPTTYEGLVWGLSDATHDLMRTWGMVAHLNSVANDAAWRKVENDFQPDLVMFSLEIGQSRPLYESTKAVLKSMPSGAPGSREATRRRILEKSIQGAELAGVGLEGAAKERFNEIQQQLAQIATDFANAVIDATKAFSYAKDGKTYTIDDANYPETMKHCADREVRERLYRARIARAPENASRIDTILKLRRESAALLGYANYAELSFATKCAPSVKAAMDMIDELDVRTVKPAADEDAELGEDLAPWDLAYAAERLRERKYAYSEDELKKHFELEDVLRGLFRLTQTLFGVEVAEVTGAAKPEVWHPDVRFFDVRENGETIASFYFDPFVRAGQKRGGAWMNEFRNRSDRRGEKPLAVLVTNFPVRDAAGRCLLPMREVETVFHEFGHALQCMLTRVSEEDAAGINLVEWDAVEVASQFMENWCLDARTCIRVPEDLKAKVRAAKNFRAASACRRQLAFAKTDLVLHREAVENPNALKNEIFAHFGLPGLPEDLFLCAFTHIFAGGYAAGYYGYKWAEVMSADCYGAFEEAGLSNDDAVERLGRRYRETILAEGGSQSALAVFREFRGREPETTALLRQQNLI